MLTDEKVAELAIAAHAGALLMDDKQPRWAFRVNPGRLNMRYTGDCVLGQSMKTGIGPLQFLDHEPPPLFSTDGSYMNKLRQLGLDPITQRDYGFAVAGSGSEVWDALTVAWRAEIAARTTAPTTAAPAEQKELVLAG